jgi:hypothetical protein
MQELYLRGPGCGDISVTELNEGRNRSVFVIVVIDYKDAMKSAFLDKLKDYKLPKQDFIL